MNTIAHAAHAARGALARRAGSDFEREIGATFDAYRGAEIAWLDFMPVPMAPAGQKERRTGQPLYRPSGTSPFDVFGWHAASGRFVGAELKSSQRKNSLPIVMPVLAADKDGRPTMKSRGGDGIKFHQIEALRNVAACGGIARLVWCNGGEYGVLREEAICNAWSGAWDALRIEQAGKTRPRTGLKSVPWDRFERVDYAELTGANGSVGQVLDWLRPELLGR